jgi:hypothetical protein
MKANLLLIFGLLIGLYRKHHPVVPVQAQYKRTYSSRAGQDFKHNGNGSTLFERLLS